MINLKSRFGKTHKIITEIGGDKSDPSAYIIPCRHGHISVHGGRMLGAATTSRGPVAKRLMALPCVTVYLDASDGVNVTFDVSAFDAVASLMGARTRRRVSEETKARLREVALKRHAGGSYGARQRAPMVGDDPKAA